jgi:uncharacterized protein (TIGR03437 family)
MVPLTRIGKRAAARVCLFSFLVCAAFAQTTPFNGRCQVSSSPNQVRSEGLAERMGDLALQCSGATPGASFGGNLSLYLPVSVTNRIDAANFTRDAVLSVDLGSGFVPTALAAQVSGNSVAFNGIQFTTPANGSVGLRISGIRAAVSQFGRGVNMPVTASLSSSLPLDQSAVIVAYPQTGLLATLYSTGITCYGSPAPTSLTLGNLFSTGTAFASTRLTEGFASAFEVRSPGSDSGTRFLVRYSGFPAAARLFVPDFVAGSDAIVPTAAGDLGVARNVGQYVPGSNTLVLARVSGADAAGAGGFPAGPPTGAPPVVLDSASEIALVNGTGFAVYEVVDASPTVQETVQFPTFIALPSAAAPSVAQETVSFAAVSSVAAASQTAPVPRFLAVPAAADCNALGDCAAAYFPKLMVDTTPLRIAAVEKGGPMTTAPAYIPIRNGSGGTLDWGVSLSYQTGSGWLFVDAAAGEGNASVRVWSDTKSLAAGVYQAAVNINAGSAGSQSIPLTLTVTAAPPPPPPAPPVGTPAVTVAKAVNAATFAVTPLVAGSLATVMGSHLGGKIVTAAFDGAPATVLYSGDTQINLQVPPALSGKTSASLVVTADGVSSAPFTVTLAPAWPAIFAHGVLNQDNGENTAASPAPPGSVLQIFATGMPKDARAGVQFGEAKDLIPLYAGDAPGAPGLQQVNIAVPAGATSANLLVCATAAGQQYCSQPYPIAVR